METPATIQPNIHQTVYVVYNVTTNLICSDFTDVQELREYLIAVRSMNPGSKFVVYRKNIDISYNLMEE